MMQALLRGGRTAVLFSMLAGAALGQSASGQERAQESVLLRLESRPQDSVRASRLDLARALLRFEAVFFRQSLDGEQLGRIHRRFDGATLMFFQSRFGAGVRELNELWARASGDLSEDALRLASLRLELTPPVLQAGRHERFEVRMVSLYEMETASEALVVPARLRLLDAEGTVIEVHDLSVVPLADGRMDVSLPLVVPDRLAPAIFSVELTGMDGTAITSASIALLPGSRDALVETWRARTESLEEDDDISEARRIFLDRCERFLSPFDSQQERAYLLDLAQLALELEAEVESLEKGSDPYRLRPGELWRTWQLDEHRSPLRCYFPPTRSENGEELPLVVALHGAGTSEDFWFEAIGGRLVELADEHGFLIAAARSSDFMARPKAMNALLDELQRCYPVDEQNIVVVGHSMGATAAARVQAAEVSRIRAFACIAGAAPFGDGAPVLVLRGQLDSISRREQLEALVSSAMHEKHPVRMQMFPDQGHTLLLHDALELALREFGLVEQEPEPEDEAGR